MSKDKDKLTAKQQAFCVEYVRLNYNGRKAGLSVGYKEHSVDQMVSRLLSLDKVKAEIDRLKAKYTAKTEITVQQIVDNLTKAAQMAESKGDIANYLRANELLGKYLAMFTDKTQVTNTNPADNITDEDRQAWKDKARQVKLGLAKVS